jgi:hypothetical protein
MMVEYYDVKNHKFRKDHDISNAKSYSYYLEKLGDRFFEHLPIKAPHWEVGFRKMLSFLYNAKTREDVLHTLILTKCDILLNKIKRFYDTGELPKTLPDFFGGNEHVLYGGEFYSNEKPPIDVNAKLHGMMQAIYKPPIWYVVEQINRYKIMNKEYLNANK